MICASDTAYRGCGNQKRSWTIERQGQLEAGPELARVKLVGLTDSGPFVAT